ncbi:hypothetical protein BKA70DRAFT_1220292 [Coprinopsis sp. MPI-PUGE-AT-0042]|nr:hypothetical protein BKA70DRAFT_1220292 [Coprinopsis sp. MPI-PUGE-AT-0042]
MFFNSIATFSLLVALLSSSVLGAPVPGAFDAELDAREPGLLPTKVHPAFSRRPNFHIIKREAEENLATREPMIAAIHPGLLNRRPIGGGLRLPRLRGGRLKAARKCVEGVGNRENKVDGMYLTCRVDHDLWQPEKQASLIGGQKLDEEQDFMN